MSDIADIANKEVQRALQRGLKNRPKFDKPSLTECIDCGEDIPPERQALGGVTRCIHCQIIFEQKTAKNR